MIQFTENELQKLRKKRKEQPWIMDILYEKTKDVRNDSLKIQTKGIGNWTMYYFCNNCSLPLAFSWNQPFAHTCPSCGKIYRGEPYDSAWWGIVNEKNRKSAEALGQLYILSEDKTYGRKAAEILLEYAKYYPDYQVHGDIPYNGPGKANAQTLDEAIFLRSLARAYDLVRDCMTEEEQKRAESRLFRCGAEFLMENRHPQLHNHEVITDAALGILGILLKEKRYIDAGIYSSYGLIYQLEHGMQEDHLWFEGSLGYHFYALENFLEFEEFAIHTEHSHIGHPNYRKMLEVVLDYVREDGAFPMLNDINAGHGGLKDKFLYEFAYRYICSAKMDQIMGLLYQNQERRNEKAFFYGKEILEKKKFVPMSCHWDQGLGHTIFRGKDKRCLIFKHGSFGGEHDHYDRLGIDYFSHGYPVIPDLGTTGYGARMHYDYYKNTGTHNTICIGESNQPPACGRTLRYEEEDGVTYVEAEVDWRKPFPGLDSYTIVQWDEERYRNVRMVRKLAWTEDYLVDVMTAEGAGSLPVDYVLHVKGERLQTWQKDQRGNKKRLEDAALEICPFSGKKPWKYLHDVTESPGTGLKKVQFCVSESDGVMLDLYLRHQSGLVYFAKGPDNPSVKDLEYLIWRQTGETPVFVTVLQSWKRGDQTDRIQDIQVKQNNRQLRVSVLTGQGEKEILFE